VRLQPFQGRGQVKDSLGPRANDYDRRLRQRGQVSRNIDGWERPASVHAADTAGCENLDACPMSRPGGGGDGSRAVQLACHNQRQVADRHLEHAAGRGQMLDLGVVQAGGYLAGKNADRGGNGASFPHDLFDPERKLEVLRVGQAMRDDSRLQRDDWAGGAGRARA
jgi:hypothetical protein